jgi:hypothetical protein
MPRLVAEETDDSSCPVEAARIWPSWFYTKFILWASFISQNSVNLAKLGGFFLVNLSDVLRVVLCLGGCYVGNAVTFLSSSVTDDALYLSGQFGRLIRLSGSFPQNPGPDILSETSKENRIEHKPLHSVNSLKHNLIALGLSGAVQVALVGDRVIGLSEVGVAEGVGQAVVEPLDGLIRLLA